MEPGLLLILTGGAASGKNTVANKLLEKFPDFKKVITTTTRKPRTGEIDGAHYHFVDIKTFEDMVKSGEMLESVNFAGNYYGTSKKAISTVFTGQNLIWIIDPSAAFRVQEILPEVRKILVIYLNVSDKNQQKERLNLRNLNESVIEKRLAQDQKDLQENHFENMIDNLDGNLDQTVEKIAGLISSFY